MSSARVVEQFNTTSEITLEDWVQVIPKAQGGYWIFLHQETHQEAKNRLLLFHYYTPLYVKERVYTVYWGCIKSQGYFWIVFPHCSTVIAVSLVSVDKFLVSLVSNHHISYRDNFILSLLNTTWRVEWAKSYQVTLCQHSCQISSVTSFGFLLYFSTVQNEIHGSGNTGRTGGANECVRTLKSLIWWISTLTVLLVWCIAIVVNNINSKNFYTYTGKLKLRTQSCDNASLLNFNSNHLAWAPVTNIGGGGLGGW